MKKRNEEILLEILEQSLSGYWDWDLPSGDEYLSPAFKRMFGYEDHEIANRADSWQRLIFAEDLPGVFDTFKQHVESRGRVPFVNEVRYRHRNGSTVWVICTGKVIEWDSSGNPLRMVGCHVDITERKRAEEAVRALSRRQEAVLAAVPDIIAEVDTRKVYTWLNRAGLDFFGEDALGREAAYYFEGEQDTYVAVQPLFSGDPNVIYLESWQRRRDGAKRLLGWWCRVLKDADGKVTGALSSARDITDVRQAEEALRHSEKQLQTYFDNAGDAIYVLESETGRIVNCNEVACTSLGYGREELLAMHAKDIEAQRSAEEISEIHPKVHATKTATVEGVHRRKDGSTFHVEIRLSALDSIQPRLILAMVRDVSERKRAEEVLAKTEKLEALGILAGGIAHDFNNLLGGLFGYVDLAAANTNQPEVADDLAMARSAIDRARGLTRQLLTFAKGGAPIKKTGRLVPFLEETARFVLSGSNVSCRIDLPPDLWPCSYDRHQLAQVIDNLVLNAIQAMPGGGTIEISGANVRLTDKMHAALPAGDYVKVAVRDHGIGMPTEILPRVFDPFFTTKNLGHGLGLATCHSILKRHGGCIDVESQPGKGSTFTFYLPASLETSFEAPSPTSSRHRGSGAILVMDDERLMRDITRSMLVTMGYTVCCAPDGAEAALRFAEGLKRGEPFAAAILDLTVPGGQGGREAVAAIRSMDKSIPVFVASGYADDPAMASPTDYGFTASICKPFLRDQLAELLNKHLGK